ncbi:MAG: transglycosylase SLT domain-containing protein, partial [bacterium]|nr:transglycosylase SLT domain-containing protein [bacterium]
PIVTMVYPATVGAAYAQNSSGKKALVFEISSKQTETLATQTQTSEIKVNPTLSNPCYPAPAGSCNPETSPAQQPIVQAQLASLAKAELGKADKTYSKEEVQALIVHYSAVYGIKPETPMCIAFRESGYNQFSKNRRSTASGVFQYLAGTWKGTDEGKAGMSVFNADANVKAAVKYMAIHKSTRPWEVRSMCPKVMFTK